MRRVALCVRMIAWHSHMLLVVAFWVGAAVDLVAAMLMIWPGAVQPKSKYNASFDYRNAGFSYGSLSALLGIDLTAISWWTVFGSVVG